jgi:hypothetical protein
VLEPVRAVAARQRAHERQDPLDQLLISGRLARLRARHELHDVGGPLGGGSRVDLREQSPSRTITAISDLVAKASRSTAIGRMLPEREAGFLGSVSR